MPRWCFAAPARGSPPPVGTANLDLRACGASDAILLFSEALDSLLGQTLKRERILVSRNNKATALQTRLWLLAVYCVLFIAGVTISRRCLAPVTSRARTRVSRPARPDQ